MNLQDTLGNEVWLKKNEASIKELLPDTWTNIKNLNGLQIGFGLKVLGVDWRSEDEFARIMSFFGKIGMMLMDGYTVKRNPDSIFLERE